MLGVVLEYAFYLFCLICIAITLTVIINLIKNIMEEKTYNKKITEKILSNIDILNADSKNESTKAKAFMVLISLSYVLVHIMENEGNNYDDAAQSKRFNEILTSSAVSKLDFLEENNGQYSF